MRWHAIEKDLFRAFGQLEFVGAGEPAASTFLGELSFFVLAACLLPFFLGPHREWLIDLGGGGAASFLFEFFDALPGQFQLPLQRHDDVDQAIDVNPSLAHVLFELLGGVHAENLSNRQPRSCASLRIFRERQNYSSQGTCVTNMTATGKHHVVTHANMASRPNSDCSAICGEDGVVLQ